MVSISVWHTHLFPAPCDLKFFLVANYMFVSLDDHISVNVSKIKFIFSIMLYKELNVILIMIFSVGDDFALIKIKSLVSLS